MHESATIAEFRTHATTTATEERRPTMLCVPSLSGRGVHHRFGVTRNPASELLGNSLFTGDLCTISVSAHDKDGAVDVYFPEALACIDRLLGSDVPAKLREVDITSSGVTYLYLLAGADGFVDLSPLQDAYLARQHNARRVMPAPA